MNVALKEWVVVVEALAQGKQDFLLRKGGIAEGKRGFELKHRRFLFFPTWEHQQQDWIRPEYQQLFESLKPADPDVLTIRHGAQVDEIRQAPADISELLTSAAHIWAEPYLRMRYEYRPDLPLYVVQVSVFTLPEPVTIPNDRRYKGCRSWVDLYQDVPV
ncbi:MAG: DUF1802 family protein [Acidobacteria bacterium]|nr:DUF1802 family protein [Acidobacteriota bacterium]MDA1234397.1 DUF1802 family protein [Acidobacteriota bacterium]